MKSVETLIPGSKDFATQFGQRFASSQELVTSLVASQASCRDAVKGNGGSNSSSRFIERLATQGKAAVRNFTDV